MYIVGYKHRAEHPEAAPVIVRSAFTRRAWTFENIDDALNERDVLQKLNGRSVEYRIYKIEEVTQ